MVLLRSVHYPDSLYLHSCHLDPSTVTARERLQKFNDDALLLHARGDGDPDSLTPPLFPITPRILGDVGGPVPQSGSAAPGGV